MSHKAYAAAYSRAKSSPTYVAEGLALDVVTSIWRVMQERGMTQKELAEVVQKNPVYINRIFNGNHNMTLRTIAEILVALGQTARIEIKPAEEACADRTNGRITDSEVAHVVEPNEEGLANKWSGMLSRRKGGAIEAMVVSNVEPANSNLIDLIAA